MLANKDLLCKVFEPGQLATVKVLPKGATLAAQISQRKGPYRVLEQLGLVYYLVDMEDKPLPHTVHGDQLLPYLMDEEDPPVIEIPLSQDVSHPDPPILTQEPSTVQDITDEVGDDFADEGDSIKYPLSSEESPKGKPQEHLPASPSLAKTPHVDFKK
ncbi:hypothetical protein IWQ61_010761, partial [Dispira simplex]